MSTLALNALADFDLGGSAQICTWQRNNDGSATDVIFTGTYTGTAPTAVEAQLDSGSFVSLSSQTIAAGNWTGTLPAVTAGSRALVLRNSNDHTVTTAGPIELMLGDFYAVAGDSVAAGDNVGACTSGVASPRNRTMHNGNSWYRLDIIGNTDNFVGTCGQLALDQGVPIGYIQGGQPGTHISSWFSASPYVDDIVSNITASFLNRVRFVCWHIGTNDVISGSNPTASSFKSDIETVISVMNAAFGFTPIHLFASIGECPSSNFDLRQTMDGVRGGVAAAVKAGDCQMGAILCDQNYPIDQTHPAPGNLPALIYRWWAAISTGVYGHPDRRGPQISNVYQSTSTFVVVTFTENLWTASLTASAWLVIANGTPITVDFADIGPADNQVTLTLHSAATAPITVSYCSNNDGVSAIVPIRAAIIAPDTTSVFLPAEPEALRATQTSGARAI